MNYRLILLDYYYQYLNKQGVKFASFCFLDKVYKSDLMKIIKEPQIITVYHLNAPRVFMKELSFNDLNKTILEFGISVKEDSCLKYEDIDNITKDAFYLKPLKKLAFNFLHIKHIEINNELNLIILAYSDSQELVLKNNDACKLYQKIIKDEEDYLQNELNKEIVSNNKNFLINTEYGLYLSPILKDSLNQDKNIYLCNNKEYPKILQQIAVFEKYNPSINILEHINYKIKFYNLIEKKLENHLYSINDFKPNINEHYTLIYIQNIGLNQLNYQELLNILEDTLYKNIIEDYYFYDNNESILVYIPLLIDQLTLEKMKNIILKKIKDLKVIYLNTAYNIGRNVNIKELLSYLEEVDEFNKDTFLIHERTFNELNYQKTFMIHKQVFNSLSNEEYGTYLGYVNIEHQNRDLYYHLISEEILNQLKNNNTDLYFRITYQEFLNKRIWYKLRKIKKDYSYSIILSNIKISSKDEFNKFVKILLKLKELEFKIYLDSSVFANIMLSDIINLYDGIYVEDYEMDLGNQDNNLFQEVIAFYLREDKKILLNQDTDLFIHQNIDLLK